ncbi:MAG: hypothetical protein ABEL97_08535, partial [Salinibacter sp.]
RTSATVTTSFQSRHHPGPRPRASVYAERLIGPLGTCTLPVMIGATVTALEGQSTWPFLVWGFPLALATASIWTQFALSRTVAAVHLREGECAVESVHEVLQDGPRQWESLYDVRETGGSIELFLEWTTYVCRRPDWPEFADLRRAARQATGAHPSRGQPSSMCA